MRTRIRFTAVLLLAALVPAASAQATNEPAAVLRDDLGREVASVGAGKRVVTLSPALAEIAFAVNAGGEVVGASAHSDYPPLARTLPVVASAAGIEWEKLLAVRPDLVLAWKDTLRPGEADRLEKAGIRLYVASGRRLDDIARTLRAVSLLTGRVAEPKAKTDFEARVTALRARAASRAAQEVLFEISGQPLRTVAGAHFINDALALCGARNAFADLPGIAPEVPLEQVLARDPAVIIGAGPAAGEAAFRERWTGRSTLRAVKDGRLVYLNADLLFRPTPRLVQGAEDLCKALDTLPGGKATS